MKPILMLGPERGRAPFLERGHIDVCEAEQIDGFVANETAYSTVIVINDGGAGTVRRLLAALHMRERRKGLCVGVLSYLEQDSLDPRLRIEVKKEVLSFEYQAV